MQSEPNGRRGGDRFHQLDALRGVAALTVLVGHILRATDDWSTSPLLARLDRTPLHALVAGRESVILFFVLSGFVLALPFLRGGQKPYGPYLVKRAFRIYVPYLVAAAVALGAFLLLAGGRPEGVAAGFYEHWRQPLTREAVWDHVLLLKPFASTQYGMVFWSLVHEMRISIVFPLLMVPVLRWPWRRSLLGAAGLSLAGTSWALSDGLRLGDGSTTLPVSVHLMAMFVVGALLAKHRAQLAGAFRRLGTVSKTAVAAAALGVFLYARFVTVFLGETATTEAVEHWLITLGSAVMIVVLLASQKAARTMTVAPLKRLGEISYSVYLYNGIVLYAAVYALHLLLPLPVILALVGPAVIVTGWLSYRVIEVPSIAGGKAMAAAMQQAGVDVARRRMIYDAHPRARLAPPVA